MGGHEYQVTTSSPFIMTDSLEVINARLTYRDAPIHLLEKFAFKDLHYAHRLLLEKAQLKDALSHKRVIEWKFLLSAQIQTSKDC
jgi:hypothetical protein